MKLPYPRPKTTRKQLETLMRDIANSPRTLTQDEMGALLVYLAPPKPKKVCGNGFELAAKLTTNHELLTVHDGIAFNHHDKVSIRAKTDMPNGYYDALTLLESEASDEFTTEDESKIAFGGFEPACMVDEFRTVRTKDGEIIVIDFCGDKYRFSKELVDIASNYDEYTQYQFGFIGKAALLVGKNEISTFVIESE